MRIVKENMIHVEPGDSLVICRLYFPYRFDWRLSTLHLFLGILDEFDDH